MGSSEPSSQLDRLRKRNIIKVAIIDNRAFWVHDNKFYTSNIVDGRIDDEHAEEIDAYSLSDKEMNLLLQVLDNLNTH